MKRTLKFKSRFALKEKKKTILENYIYEKDFG
jgi:hypothetical protein